MPTLEHPLAGRLCVALDLSDLNQALDLARSLRGLAGLFKVGLELFTAAGPDAVRTLVGEGFQVFLDLKLHDIPATVARAAARAKALGATYLTVHAAAGSQALRVACQTGPKILAVTVLTSLGSKDLKAIGLVGPTQSAVERLGKLALDAGVSGLVCSPKEVASLRTLAQDRLLVVPGIRPAGHHPPGDDQRRAATPAAALRAGADILVVGRPIRSAADPKKAALAILEELSRTLPQGS